jgi:poly(3-hydroxybutyrate) depolymerase
MFHPATCSAPPIVPCSRRAGLLLCSLLIACGAEPATEDADLNADGEDDGTWADATATGSYPEPGAERNRGDSVLEVEGASTRPIPITRGQAPARSSGAQREEPSAAPDLASAAPAAGAAVPVLPEFSGDCPEFRSGTQTIAGLSTEIVAGEPGEVKGPLLFTWHGTGGNGRQALRQLPRSVQDEIVAQGGIIIAPSDNGQVRSGRDVTFVLGVWYDGSDLALADQIVACAVKNHNIDPRRIYVTGCSAGGLMAGVMSLERSAYVAAAAPNSGGIATTQFSLEDEARLPAVMSMHGGSTDTVGVNFGTTSRNLTNVLKPKGAFVVECNHGSGHCGAPASLHEQAWEFMKAHPFGTRPSPFASGLPEDFPDFCSIQ